ncbi:MAG: rRNA maturation RNase YbeY [Deltaproteobacteria bacterium]|nr:rRNA maturation RNase YbeY [Deltaproteobacteria bacterium]MCL5277386.1 rRNA maturation RNase YbeY [Deltaproteobacteria bacterium]
MDIQISSRYKKNSGSLKVVSIRLKRFAAVFDDAIRVYVVFADDPVMKGLNLRFRHKDSTTNVLSFQLNQSDPEDGRLILGEIVISVDTARREAAAAGMPVERRLEALFVHGFVHLLGYDHTKGGRMAALMRGKEDTFMAILGAQDGKRVKKV